MKRSPGFYPLPAICLRLGLIRWSSASRAVARIALNASSPGPKPGNPGFAAMAAKGLVRVCVVGLVWTLLPPDASAGRSALARQIMADSSLDAVHNMAGALLRSDLNAGGGYVAVWIRDFNTFIEQALRVNDPAQIRAALLVFFHFQGKSGDIPDNYRPTSRAAPGTTYRTSASAPEVLAFKNTSETDQESSLIQAVRKYVDVTGDRSILDERVDGVPVLARMEQALSYVRTERFDGPLGLVWGSTTVDWGDVQPEEVHGVLLDGESHRAIDIYDNAMYLKAIDDFLWLNGRRQSNWHAEAHKLRRSIRRHLWDKHRQQFVPHLYLGSSPFPPNFDEDRIYYHGGTAVAIEADLLSRNAVRDALARMVDDMEQAGASSIGLTLYPPYPAGYFQNPAMAPWDYQNGGDWDWFGGRMIQQLIRFGLVDQAYQQIKPMVSRIAAAGDFYEFWTRDSQPRGSNQFRGAAGVVGQAIEMLRAWAEENQRIHKVAGKKKPKRKAPVLRVARF